MLNSSRILLREIRESDLKPPYVNWLNDSEVNSFLETRFVPQSIESIRAYWQNHRDAVHCPWFAIELIDSHQHIGNIKLGPIDWVHRRADISLFIGDKASWGKGYASEAIFLISKWAFNQLDLYKLSSGMYATNIGSRRAFEKAGFVLEATFKDEVYSSGSRVDMWRMGLLRPSFDG